jgi:DNA mismatch endonuclease (patch repair protein)
MDVHSPKQRSYNMSQIKGKNTKPELMVRKILWEKGYRYRLQYKNLPGKPDIVFPGRKKVIFINGCFWHKHDCNYFKWPKSNSDFWLNKIESNVTRDNERQASLLALGWIYLIIWECAIREASKIVMRDKNSPIVTLIEKFLSSENCKCMEIDLNGIHDIQNSN